MKVVEIARKTHEIAPFLKITPNNGSQLRCSRHAALRHVNLYPNPQNIIVAPPPRNPAYDPAP